MCKSKKLEKLKMRGNAVVTSTIKRFEKAPLIGEICNRPLIDAGWFDIKEDWPTDWSEWNNVK